LNLLKPSDWTWPLRPMKVLIADDIERSRLELQQAVQALGHSAICCDSGSATLAAVPESAPDIVLLDLLMPDMDGYEVTRRLREMVTQRWLPVIVTSALQGDGHFVDALSRGADDYLPRPVHPDLLKARLTHYQRVLAVRAQMSWIATRERLVHEHIPDCVFTFDQEMRLCYANRAARELLAKRGYTDNLGQSAMLLLGCDETAEPRANDLQIAFLDGSVGTYSVGSSEWTWEDGVYNTIVLRDRSEYQRIERMKEEFLATVSHELRTPLTSIIGAISILNAGAAGAMPPKAIPLLQMAQRNGERLSRLIDDVMDVTKLEGDHGQLNLRQVALRPLLQEAMRAMMGYAASSAVQLQLQEPVPEAVVVADEERTLQVMVNLLSNAVKHSPHGATVQVALLGEGRNWCIEVRDQGAGVPEQFRPHLFEKFAQADSSDRRINQGTGLGLYISRILARRMGGDIGLARSDAEGSVFYVRLKAASLKSVPTMVIARDISQRDRFTEWISGCGPVTSVADLAGAHAWIAHNGPVAAVVADVTSQGGADAFFSAIVQFCPLDAIVLVGDAADHAFARARGVAWVAPGPLARTELVRTVDKARLGALTAESSKHA
jgi:signal transduction histidine kinase